MTPAVENIYDMNEFLCWVQKGTQDVQLRWRGSLGSCSLYAINQTDKQYSVIVVKNIAPLNIKPIYISWASC